MAKLRPIDVVFVHGLLSSAEVWTDFKKLIARDAELANVVTGHYFEYASPFVRFRPYRRVPDIDDIANRLRTYLTTELDGARTLVLVSHSQGGLVIQRFLARTLADGQGRELARIKRIVMFACPNTGSEFMLSARQAGLWRNPQERELRPMVPAVVNAQRIVLQAIVNAKGSSESECRIPIIAYGGISDKIVPPVASVWVFPSGGILDGDHFTVVRPKNATASSYVALKKELLTAAAEPARTPGPGGIAGAKPAGAARRTKPTAPTEPSDSWPQVSVVPPFGRRSVALQDRIDLMASIMSSGQRSKVHILAGLAGSGKSRLALEIAYIAWEQGRQVWWIDEVRINSRMREVANQLGAPDGQVERAWRGAGSETDLIWRSLDAHSGKWLLIFDNIDDPQRLGPDGGLVSDGTGWLRQPAGDGMVIVTSRNRNQATWGNWVIVHPVPPLETEDGAALLMDQVGSAGGTLEQARLLSAELGGLPLALRCAADYLTSVITSTIWSGEAPIRDFDSYRAAVHQRFGSPPVTPGGDLSEPLGLGRMRLVLDLSLQLLADRGLTHAAPLLKLLACLNIEPIPYHVVLKGSIFDQSMLLVDFAPQRRAVLDGLATLGLIELAVLDNIDDPDLSHVLSLHPVVHGILRGDADVKRRPAEYYGLCASLLLTATEGVNPDFTESWAIWYSLVPHTVEVARAILLGASPTPDRRVLVSALELARRTSRYLIAAGLLASARELVLDIIDRCQEFGFQPDDREILSMRHERGRLALERGDLQAAEAEFRQVIAARERVLGASHADTLASRHKLAKTILEQGRFTEAEPLLRSIVEAEQTVRGPEHSDTMVVTHSLARATLTLGNAAAAEAMCRDILRIRQQYESPDSPETLFVRQTLARSLLEQERAVEAEDEVRDALAHATGHPDVPIALALRHTLATALLMQERTAEAVAELTPLLIDRRRVLGPTHPETERTRQMLTRAQATMTTQPTEPDIQPFVPRQAGSAAQPSEL